MPLVQIKLIEGVVSADKKREMIEKVTDAVVAIEGEPIRPYTVVMIDEVKSGDWAYGGRTLTTDEVKAVASGKGKAA